MSELTYEKARRVLQEAGYSLPEIARVLRERGGARDRFAGAALQGLLASGAMAGEMTPADAAGLAWAIADAMLAPGNGRA